MGHLHKFELENFRLFKEMQGFDFAPITLFTGVNNSGKSSVIKSLLLLKESFNKSKKISELLFTESKHNLGSFTQCINNQSGNNNLKFRLPLNLKYFGNDCSIELEYRPNLFFSENGYLRAIKIFYKDREFITLDRNPDLYEAKKLKQPILQQFEGYEIEQTFKIDLDFIESFIRDELKKMGSKNQRIDDFPSDEEWSKQMLSDEREKKRMNSSFYSFSKLHGDIDSTTSKREDNSCEIDFNENIFALKDKTDQETKNEEVKLRCQLDLLKATGLISTSLTTERPTDDPYSTDDPFMTLYLQMINFLPRNFEPLHAWDDYGLNAKLTDFGKMIFTKVLKESMIDSISSLQKTIRSIYSLSSLRGNTERLYSNNSEIVDLNNIIIQFLESDVYRKHSLIEKFINKSLKLFNIGDRLSIDRHQGVSSEIFIHRGAKKILLADLGFGFTQLLPIILKVAIIAKQNHQHNDSYSASILILEEPESNLHPSYQSKLADLLLDAASTFNIQFIVETHSEYLIRKLQYLVAKKDLKPRNVSLFYFHEPNRIPNGEKLVKKIEIKIDGSLSDDFGTGFFDEALNWKFEILKLKNKN